jgi:prepilin-type N-terminal cleavage/methylation domain-containing protein
MELVMISMRNGFTMIELIFVIVIIGILASVAIPKLAATRDDAADTRILANFKLCKDGIINEYASKGTPVQTSISVLDACQGNKNGTRFGYVENRENRGYVVELTYELTYAAAKTEIFRYAGNFVTY